MNRKNGSLNAQDRAEKKAQETLKRLTKSKRGKRNVEVALASFERQALEQTRCLAEAEDQLKTIKEVFNFLEDSLVNKEKEWKEAK